MEKFKHFLIKYKWYVAGGAGLLIVLFLLRSKRGSGSGSGVIQTSYTTSDGSIGNSYTDPSLMLAQLESQTNLAAQTADLQGQLNLAQMQYDFGRYELDSNTALGIATIDANKFISQLDANTQTAIAGLNATTQQHVANAQVQTAQIQGNVMLNEIDANKYIAGRQADIAKYQAQTARRGQEYGAIQGLLNWGGGFFK